MFSRLGLKGTYLCVCLPGSDKVLTFCEVHVRGEELSPDEDGYGAGTGDTNYGDDREYREAN